MTTTWRAYFELLRFPAVFTAVADVAMGYLVTRGQKLPPVSFVMLATVSVLLYLSGMVLNDVFDAAADAQIRPQRPIPSGRVRRSTAAALGWGLLVLGLALALQFSDHCEIWRPAIVAVALAACIVLYDALAKQTLIGPLVMGGCRFANVLLGMSLAAQVVGPRVVRAWTPSEWQIALGAGVYVAGVTFFARQEAGTSSRGRLAAGIAILIAGMATITAAPLTSHVVALRMSLPRWWLLWTLLAAVIIHRCFVAWRSPTADRVQQAVRVCLRSIIVIDAAIVLGYCGPFWGCAVIALLAPMLVLERWASTT